MVRKQGDRNDRGFTLMETLVTIVVVMVISANLITALVAGLRGIEKAVAVTKEAAMILRIDRFIREEAGRLHISYWERADRKAAGLRDSLFRSRYGSCMRGITAIHDRNGLVRGIQVTYMLNTKTYRTEALFPSKPVAGNR